MIPLAERLRGVLKPTPARAGSPSLLGRAGSGRVPASDAAAEQLGGVWQEAGDRRFLVVDRRYGPGHRHGRVTLADAAPPVEGWPRLSLFDTAASGRDLVFVDLETTGLAGGAGTYAFLVGCAWFDGCAFHVRQYFLSDFAAERVMLEAVAARAEQAATVVTYNGKSFDLPLIETRAVLNRVDHPFDGMPHVDLLHPARRLWRTTGGSSDVEDEAGPAGCRLTALERTLLGHARAGDVPGFEIPSRYFDYVRSGDAAGLEAVLEHNRLDLLSLALLTARAVRLLDEGAHASRSGREALGLGWYYERAGLVDDALDCFARASSAWRECRPQAVGAEARLLRRLRRFDEAAVAWQRLLGIGECPLHLRREATEALAVHHEHRLRDPGSARDYALGSLRLEGGLAKRRAAEHRLARLDRKLGRPQAEASPLF